MKTIKYVPKVQRTYTHIYITQISIVIKVFSHLFVSSISFLSAPLSSPVPFPFLQVMVLEDSQDFPENGALLRNVLSFVHNSPSGTLDLASYPFYMQM